MSSSSNSDDISLESSGFATDDEEEQRDRLLEKQNLENDLRYGGLDDLISEPDSSANPEDEQQDQANKALNAQLAKPTKYTTEAEANEEQRKEVQELLSKITDGAKNQ